MSRSYAIAGEQLIRFDDDEVMDFVSDVETSAVMHEQEGLSPFGLSDHADEIRQIADGFIDSIIGNTRRQPQRNTIWRSLVHNALTSPVDEAEGFMDAYSYMRLNRWLAADFGPAETETTQAIRDLGNVVIQLMRTDQITVADNFYDNHFSTTLLERIYCVPDPGTSHNAVSSGEIIIRQRIEQGTSLDRDPALHRMLATFNYRGADFIDELPQKAVQAILLTPDIAFRGEHRSGQHKDAETIESNDRRVDYEFGEGVLDKPIGEFNPSDAACRITAESEPDPELRAVKQKRINQLMFSHTHNEQEQARKICEGCPERPACLEFALRHNIGSGMWGGVSERGRQRLRRETRPVGDVTRL